MDDRPKFAPLPRSHDKAAQVRASGNRTFRRGFAVVPFLECTVASVNQRIAMSN
jgi:hypothetical protein